VSIEPFEDSNQNDPHGCNKYKMTNQLSSIRRCEDNSNSIDADNIKYL
jgi:hypothetical protein